MFDEPTVDWRAPASTVPTRNVVAGRRMPVLDSVDAFGIEAQWALRAVGPWLGTPRRPRLTADGLTVQFDFDQPGIRVGKDVAVERLSEVARSGLLRMAEGDDLLGVQPIPRPDLDRAMHRIAALVTAELTRRDQQPVDPTDEGDRPTTELPTAAPVADNVEPVAPAEPSAGVEAVIGEAAGLFSAGARREAAVVFAAVWAKLSDDELLRAQCELNPPGTFAIGWERVVYRYFVEVTGNYPSDVAVEFWDVHCGPVSALLLDRYVERYGQTVTTARSTLMDGAEATGNVSIGFVGRAEPVDVQPVEAEPANVEASARVAERAEAPLASDAPSSGRVVDRWETDEVRSRAARRLRGHVLFPPKSQSGPALGGQEGRELPDMVAHAHFFSGGMDWWLLEYDPVSTRAFGVVDLGHGPEMGYFSLGEMDETVVTAGAAPMAIERDLYWSPTRLGDIRELADWNLLDPEPVQHTDHNHTASSSDVDHVGSVATAIGAASGDNTDEIAAEIGSAVDAGHTVDAAARFAAVQRLVSGEVVRAVPPKGAMERAWANVEALRVLADGGDDTELSPAEREVLERWSGWGACPKVFDETEAEWAEVRGAVQGLLCGAEWDAARRTVLNAHYTDHRIVEAMTGLVQRVDTGGRPLRVLEPGCGSGNFVDGAVWARPVEAIGVELDPTTAAVARRLHPDATIRAEGFEKSNFADGVFDATVGNVPFGSYRVFDPVHNADRHSIHNHFIIKSLALTAPGGMVAVVTSRYTLDSADVEARRAMWDMADLVGVARLPENAHQATAGTHVVTDVLVFRRRNEDETPQPFTWEHTERRPDLVTGTPETQDAPTVNLLFGHTPSGLAESPPHPMVSVGGTFSTRSGQFTAHDFTVVADGDSTDAAAAAINELAAAVDRRDWRSTAAELAHTDWGTPVRWEREGTIRSTDTGFERVENGRFVEWKPRQVPAEIRALCALRDRLVAVLEAQAASDDDDVLAPLQAAARRAYESYRSRFGAVNRFTLSSSGGRRNPLMGGFRKDPSFALVAAAERYDDDSGTVDLADIFHRRVLTRPVDITRVDTVSDALGISLDETGGVDLERMAELLDSTPEEVEDAAGDLIFRDPVTLAAVERSEYLSGDVRQKLVDAKSAAEADGDRWFANVQALEAVHPVDLVPDDIQVAVGAVWLELADYQAFFTDMGFPAKVTVTPNAREWKVEQQGWSSDAYAASRLWSTKQLDVYRLFECALKGSAPQVTVEVDGRRVVDQIATAEAGAAVEKLTGRFAQWLWENPERSATVCARYNRMFNSAVERNWDGSHMRLRGLAVGMEPHKHQRDAVWRILCEPTVLLDHAVGAGKTGEMVMAAMELRRLGRCRQPWIVVPNHMLEQVSREVLEWYPGARVLVGDREQMRTADGKRAFAAASAMNDWDVVVVTQSTFESISVSDQTWEDYIAEERAQLAEDRAAKVEGGDNRGIKAYEKALAALDEKLAVRRSKNVDNGGLVWEQVGCDYLFYDEAHYVKNVPLASHRREMSRPGSARAVDMELKLRSLRARFGPKVATFATGTPVANSMVEAWAMERFLRPDLLKAKGLASIDAWLSTFTKSVSRLEMKPSGKGWRVVDRICRYRNVPELVAGFRTFADVMLAKDLNLAVPTLRDGKPETIVVEQPASVAAFIDELDARAERLAAGGVEPDVDNMLKITHEGSMAALDPRTMGLDPDPSRTSKVEAVADRTAQIWAANRSRHYSDGRGGQSSTPGALQVVFCDRSTPSGEWNFYDQLRDELIARGVPASGVRFIHEAKNDAQKARLFKDCREGKVAVLVGSTEKMGTGMNVQRRLIAVHHADCPWRPADLEQRDGRVLRQGNENPEVEVLRYVTEGTFDVYKWQKVEEKAAFIYQLRAGTQQGREIEDFGEAALSFAEVKALASGDSRVIERAQLAMEVEQLGRLRDSYTSNLVRARRELASNEASLERAERRLPALLAAASKMVDTAGAAFRAETSDGQYFTERAAYGDWIVATLAQTPNDDDRLIPLGTLGGIDIKGRLNGNNMDFRVEGNHHPARGVPLEREHWRIATKLETMIAQIPQLVENTENTIAYAQSMIPVLHQQLETTGFDQEHEYQTKTVRLTEINQALEATATDEAQAARAIVEDRAGADSVDYRPGLDHQVRDRSVCPIQT